MINKNMKIWIEVELNWWEVKFTEVLEWEELSLSSFKDIWDLWVKLSEEYYDNTIEYNFYPLDYSEKKLDDVKKYLEKQKDKYWFSINGHSPAFVWTHIHFFDRVRMPKGRLLNWVMSFILENIESISNQWLERLIKAHQIWGFYSHRNWHFWANTLIDRWYHYVNYESSARKNKYVPIFHSRATESGKPVSLEIRCIPNDFIFNWKIKDLLKEIEDKSILEREEVDKVDFFNKLIDKHSSFRSSISVGNSRNAIRSLSWLSCFSDYSDYEIDSPMLSIEEADYRISNLTEYDKILFKSHIIWGGSLWRTAAGLSRDTIRGINYNTLAFLIKRFYDQEGFNIVSDWTSIQF